MTQSRDERFISALSGQSTPGVAAGVTGAEQRHAGNTHDPVLCITSQFNGVYRSTLRNARGRVGQRRSER